MCNFTNFFTSNEIRETFNKCPNLTSLTPLFKGSDVPTEVAKYKVGLLLMHRRYFGRMPFLPPPMAHMVLVGSESRLDVHKSATFTTELLLKLLKIRNQNQTVETT